MHVEEIPEVVEFIGAKLHSGKLLTDLILHMIWMDTFAEFSEEKAFSRGDCIRSGGPLGVASKTFNNGDCAIEETIWRTCK